MRIPRPTTLALVLAACGTPSLPVETTSDSSSSSTSGDASSGGETGSTSAPSSSDPGSTGDDSTGVSTSSSTSSTTAASTTEDGTDGTTTAPAPVCGDGILDDGEDCDDGNADDTDACLAGCLAASCGDGNLWAGVEECDDGNAKPGDGCSETCTLERWEHYGVAHDVPIADLQLWEPCWSSTYEAGPLLAGVSESCLGDHLLVACRPLEGDTLTLAAHAPRADIFAEVNYKNGERTQVNGVDFYWSPPSGVVGFGPPGAALCYGQGPTPDDNICWTVDLTKFLGGWQCGSTILTAFSKQTMWERVVFQAWE